VWVLRLDGSLVYATRGENRVETAPTLPLTAPELKRVLATEKEANFFVRQSEELLELCFAPVRPTSDTARKGPPRGWLVAARVWNPELLKLIGGVTQSETELVSPGQSLPSAQPNEISLKYPLFGFDGTPAAELRYAVRSAELAILSGEQRKVLGLFIGTLVLTAVVAIYFVFRDIVRPLKLVGESLSARDGDAITPLLGRNDEIGRVAQAVKMSFEQHAALEQMIEGRTRLGRELHDGVIQTVFAAGMNLAGARSALRENPAEADAFSRTRETN
jgi:methyl-accepting chemotaxis protein